MLPSPVAITTAQHTCQMLLGDAFTCLPSSAIIRPNVLTVRKETFYSEATSE
ncbi:hypothetical protein DPMN_118777 [Dreissena polymorpha]|uniref:Uncharacterized protein n=1 Tax=Dreissena polymorpha TaxID=45954 RepID=A0A9D4GLB7_DREPO|nr:hypothetical protein DPMN_118777 [Dreissena polymorpha]